VTTTADKDGNWSYTVSGLAAGDHYVEASVADPATKQTSPVAKLLSFTVTAPKATTTVATAKKSNTGMYIILLVVLTMLSACGWYCYKWFGKRKNGNGPSPLNPGELPPTQPTN
jgi:hypothetical protein